MPRTLLLRFLATLLFAGAAVAFAQEAPPAPLIFRGMTEQEMIEALGPPQSDLARGSLKFCIYPTGKIELRDGRVYTAEGISVSYRTPDERSQFAYSLRSGWTYNGEPAPAGFRVTEAPPPPAPGDGPRRGAWRYGEELPPPTNASVGAPPEPAPKPEAPQAAQEATEIVLDDPGMEAEAYEYEDWENDTDDEDWENWEYEEPAWVRWVTIIVGFFVEFILTTLMLKIAFHISGFPVLWKQLLNLGFAMALISVILDLLLNAIGMGDSWMIKSAVSYGALAGLIYAVTDVTEGITALKIAFIARAVTIVVSWVVFFVLFMLIGIVIAGAGAAGTGAP